MPDRYYSTREVAELLDIKPGTLSMAVWEGRIPKPEMGPGRCFLWADADIARAARVFGITWSRPAVAHAAVNC